MPPTTTTHARYRVVALATGLAMVTYLDRTAIGTLAPQIRRDLGLSAVEMGWVFTAFQLAYGLFEIPTGRWADRVGTRSVLARIVIWWSVMTMATAGGVQLRRHAVGAIPVSAPAKRARGRAWRAPSRDGFRSPSAAACRASSSAARTWLPG